MQYESTTTLRRIRDAQPCRDGWTKLLKHLDKTAADDEPLDLLTILDSNGFDDALWVLSHAMPDDRLARHFQAWCAEKVLHIFESARPGDARVRDQIAMLRNDDASPAERDEARAEAWDAARAARSPAAMAASRAAYAAAEYADKAASDAADAAAYAAVYAAVYAARASAAWPSAWAAADAAAYAAVYAAVMAGRIAAASAAADAARAAARADQEHQLRLMLGGGA